MNRCVDCHSTLLPDEQQCFNCGAKVKVEEPGRVVFLKKFTSFLNIAFWASALLTIGALFVDFFPPFIRCLMLTLILLIIRSSAWQMLDKKKG